MRIFGRSNTHETVLRDIRARQSSFWMKKRDENMLDLFHKAASRVPAYKDFLQKNGISSSSVRSVEDLKKIPATSKANYLRAYPMKDLCWDGSMQKPFVFAATSGSTGKPFYFPHTKQLTYEYSILADLFLGQRPAPGPTLVLITFGMGVWIGGVFTFQAFEMASERGANVSILTPGVNKSEILHALRELAPNFTQTILVGYPPFVKDVLDDAQIEGIDLEPLNIRVLCAAESFTEKFRDHLATMTHIKNPLIDTLNIYGTADIGAMAWETPTSIMTRRLALKDPNLFTSLFGETQKTPTLAQYNPHFTNFETQDGEILLTGDNAIPLLRYAVGDRGGVLAYDEAAEKATAAGISISDELSRAGAPEYRLPFVYVYERADFSTKLYGAIIYSEHIREALQDENLLKFVTGKFAMQTLTDAAHDQYLEINVELREHSHESQELVETLSRQIVSALMEKNSEYRNNHASMKEKVHPKIVLWPHEDPKYFKPTIKQKWVIK